jgi:hypothetical protein
VNGRYILIGQTPVPCEDLLEWGRWMQDAKRQVMRTDVCDYFVSTVFLGLDHRFGDGQPLLFKTMIFLRAELNTGLTELVDYQRRYSDWTAAECGHEEAVRLVEQLTGAPRLVSCHDSEE